MFRTGVVRIDECENRQIRGGGRVPCGDVFFFFIFCCMG